MERDILHVYLFLHRLDPSIGFLLDVKISNCIYSRKFISSPNLSFHRQRKLRRSQACCLLLKAKFVFESGQLFIIPMRASILFFEYFFPQNIYVPKEMIISMRDFSFSHNFFLNVALGSMIYFLSSLGK